MPDEHPFTLRQVDLARADFAAIEDHLDFHQGSARAHADADGAGAHRARDRVRRGGAGDLVVRNVLAARVVRRPLSHFIQSTLAAWTKEIPCRIGSKRNSGHYNISQAPHM